MGDNTGIEWTDATWNPIVGCSVVSPGCTNCYAMSMAARIEAMARAKYEAWREDVSTIGVPEGTTYEPFSNPYAGTTQRSKAGPVWTGKVALASESTLVAPLRWRRPRKIFVNSMGDLFHESVPDEWIDKVFAIMALAPWHTFQLLTKRSDRMLRYVGNLPNRDDLVAAAAVGGEHPLLVPAEEIAPLVARAVRMPLPNVWLGVSAEDQARADERIPDLIKTPAAVRFVSCEPLLGPIDILDADDYAWGSMTVFLPKNRNAAPDVGISPDASLGGAVSALGGHIRVDDRGIDWVIAGGESGPNARPMDPEWVRGLRDECAVVEVPFLLKQWGEWAPYDQIAGATGWEFTRAIDRERRGVVVDSDGNALFGGADFPTCYPFNTGGATGPCMVRVGKKRAGRLLDGRLHDAFPGRS